MTFEKENYFQTLNAIDLFQDDKLTEDDVTKALLDIWLCDVN
jgi:hypothetical protein